MKKKQNCLLNARMPLLSTPFIPDDYLDLRIQSLNKKQRETFGLVHKLAKESVKNKSSKRPIKINNLHLFITGKGGCGESHLFKTIYHSLTKTLSYHDVESNKLKVLLLSPTDVAAINIY